MEKKMICIVCPIGCNLSIDLNSLEVTGNKCPRGEVYAKEELINPKRVITSTVKIEGGIHRRVPVKTEDSIPKSLNFKCMEEIAKVQLKSPVKVGDIVIENLLGTGVNVVVTRDM